MDHFEKIYATQAQEYHEMIAPEDVEGNLIPALTKITPFANKTILDIGSGTGRIPLLTHSIVKEIVGLDLNLPMLVEQRVQQNLQRLSWPLVNADNRKLPFRSNYADVITAGWAIGHLRSWYEENWQEEMGYILQEMERVVAPNGCLLIMETLSTGSLEPTPPTPGLAEYYDSLENDWGYTRHTIPTDYQFESIEDAVEKTEFFFGTELAETIRKNNWVRLPEWTGIWSKQVK